MHNFLKYIPSLFIAANLTITSFAQTNAESAVKELKPEEKHGNIGKLTATIISNQHYNQQPINNDISSELFDEYFKTLDPTKIYFTKSDISKFEHERYNLDDSLVNNNVDFAYEVYNLLLKKIKLYKSFAEQSVKKGFDFTINEEFITDRSKVERAQTDNDLKEIWRKRIKNEILGYKLIELTKDENEKESAFHVDRTPEEKILKKTDQYLKRLEQNDELDVLEFYLMSLTKIYDPHSTYMKPRTQKDFDINMKLSFGGIGAVLKSEDGYTAVVKLIPGGPAEAEGSLKADDRITAVAQEGEEPVNIIDMPLSRVVELIRGPKKSKVLLTILESSKGINALPKTISITRGTVKLKDSEASGEVKTIKNSLGKEIKLGVITLPSFYMDFKAAMNNEDYKSSTRDVKKIINNFKKEQVEGIVFDIRSNGGGSLLEAISLSGLFIKSGPIVQVKDQSGAIKISDDPDPSVFYDGPLVILMNKLSASASEIFAGAMKDYNRAILVGDRSTHGKGTVQTIFDLNKLLPYWRLRPPAGSIKFTNAKFYRVNGESTQKKGVIPDITFPSFTDSMDIGEDSLEHALPWDTIPSADYSSYSNNLASIIEKLKSNYNLRKNENPEYKKLLSEIERYNEIKDKIEVTLNEAKRKESYLNEKEIQKSQEKALKLNQSEEDKEAKEKDLYLDESLNILSDYIMESSVAKTVSTKY